MRVWRLTYPRMAEVKTDLLAVGRGPPYYIRNNGSLQYHSVELQRTSVQF